jgi:hypothetical protein
MPDDKNQDLNKNMGANREQEGTGQKAPGRDVNDDLSTGNRQGGGIRGTEREGQPDREDQERQQPGSKQTDKSQ